MDVHVVSGAAAPQVQAGPLQPQPQAPATTEAAALPSKSDNMGPLSPIVAHLVGGGDVSQSVSVNVSYRVEHNPNIVVMVMTDPHTGQEIAQVPAEVMVQIAQFFDKQQGVTVDRSA